MRHTYEKKSDIYGTYRHKMTFHPFLLSTDDPVNMPKGYTVQRILNLRI